MVHRMFCFFKIVLPLMPFHITKFGGFPFPGPVEGLAFKVALAARFQIHLWLEVETGAQGGKDKPRPEAQGHVGNLEAEPRLDTRMPVPCGGGRRKNGTRRLRAGLAGHAAMKTLSPHAWVSSEQPVQGRASQHP